MNLQTDKDSPIEYFAAAQNLRIAQRQLSEAIARNDVWDADVLRIYVARYTTQVQETIR